MEDMETAIYLPYLLNGSWLWYKYRQMKDRSLSALFKGYILLIIWLPQTKTHDLSLIKSELPKFDSYMFHNNWLILQLWFISGLDPWGEGERCVCINGRWPVFTAIHAYSWLDTDYCRNRGKQFTCFKQRFHLTVPLLNITSSLLVSVLFKWWWIIWTRPDYVL